MKKIIASFLILFLLLPTSASAALQVGGVGAAALACTGGDQALIKAAGITNKASDYLNKQINKGLDAAGKAVSDLFKSKAKKEAEKQAKALGKEAGKAALKLLGLKANDTTGGAASAAVPVSSEDITKSIDTQGEAQKKATNENTTQREQRTRCLDALAYAASRTALLSAASTSTNWINTGFNGNPLYVQDVTSYVKSLTNQNISNYLNVAQNTDPVFGNVLRSVITEQTTGKIDGLISTPLNTPQAKAYDRYMGDFKQGGWNSLLRTDLNPISAVFKATDTLSENINTSIKNSTDELNRNGGFFDSKECVEWQKDGRITTKPSDNGLSGEVTCTKWKVLVPGSIIKNRTEAFTTTDIRQLEMADTMSKSLSAFFDKMINNLITKGLGHTGDGITAFVGDSATAAKIKSGGFGSNVVLGSDGRIISQADVEPSASTNFDIADIVTLRGLLKTQYDFINVTKDSYAVKQQITPTLGELDYCLPGPNSNWFENASNHEDLFYNLLSAGDGTEAPPWQFAIAKHTVNDPILEQNLIFGEKKFNIKNPDPISVEQVAGNLICQVISGIPIIGSFVGDCSRTRDVARPVEASVVADGFRNWFVDYADTTIETYSTENIVNAFINTNNPANYDKSYIKGTITDALQETGNINQYNSDMKTSSQEDIDTLTDIQKYSTKLASIYSRTQTIVATARARKNKAMQAAGTDTTEMARINSCLDTKYLTSSTPVTGNKQQQSNTPTANIVVMQNAQATFYQKLKLESNITSQISTPGNGSIIVGPGASTIIPNIFTFTRQTSTPVYVYAGANATNVNSYTVKITLTSSNDPSILKGNFRVVLSKQESGTDTKIMGKTRIGQDPYNGASTVIQSLNNIADLSKIILGDTFKNTIIGTSGSVSVIRAIDTVVYTVEVIDNATGKTIAVIPQTKTAPF